MNFGVNSSFCSVYTVDLYVVSSFSNNCYLFNIELTFCYSLQFRLSHVFVINMDTLLDVLLGCCCLVVYQGIFALFISVSDS